ncbi:MAG TPA: hypothetical protein VN181_03890, partial [Thermoanaerobaculia bacterium]|nr:hypothetical protein [Thermoanaerobaculia bacterium]
MNARTLAALMLLLALPLGAQQSIPQYTVSLKPLSFSGVPALHSFARAVGPQGQWLVVTGRTNGLHTFTSSQNNQPPANAFPPQQANNKLWVIDPASQKVYSANVPAPPLGDSLTVNNAQFYQDADTLYVIGGYGNQTSTSTMTTFSTITAIPVSKTITAIMNGTALPAFQQVTTWYDCNNAASNAYNTCLGTAQGACQPGPSWQQCMLDAATSCTSTQTSTLSACNTAVLSGNATAAKPYLSNTGPSYAMVAGGGMEKVGKVFWLVFGQNFQGLYSVNPGDYGRWPTMQQYTERMAALWIGTMGGQPAAAVLNVLQGNPNPTGNPATA